MKILFHSDVLGTISDSAEGVGQELIRQCREGNIKGWVSSYSISDWYDNGIQTQGEAVIREKMRELLKIFSILTPTAAEIRQSLAEVEVTPEVALASATASSLGLDGIVTLNPAMFQDSSLAVLNPEGLLDRLDKNTESADRVSLLDIPASYHEILNDVENEIAEVIRSGYFVLGPKVAQLEKEVAELCHSEFAVGVSSGTDALLLSLMAAGIGPGDEVITTPFTFFATVGSIVRLGARPVFVDIEESTFNIDPNKIASRITPRTRAIMPVHLYGQCADMDPILEIAKKHDLIIIEDAAQAIGAEYKKRRAGSLGHFGCFSFFPTKNLGGFGDGGMITVSSETIFDKLNTLRVHGSKPKYYHKLVGGNFRLDALQAGVLLAKLKYLPAWTALRRSHAKCYDELFEDHGLRDRVQLPQEIFQTHVYNQYVIRVGDQRDTLRQFLAEKNVATEIYYPLSLHRQECFADLGHTQGDFPLSEKAAEETLALPISQEVTQAQQGYVVEMIKQFFG